MKKLLVTLVGITLLFTFVLACSAPRESVEAPAPQQAPAFAEVKKAGWELEWDKTLKAARSERRVVVVSTAGAPVRTVPISGREVQRFRR